MKPKKNKFPRPEWLTGEPEPPKLRLVGPLPFHEWCRQRVGVELSLEQRVYARVAFDGVDPIDLTFEERDVARKIFGGIERYPDFAKGIVAQLKGRGMGGTYLAALYLAKTAEEVDLSCLAPGEIAFAPIVAPVEDLGSQALNYISGAVTEHNLFTIEKNATEEFVVAREDGKRVSFQIFAASRGGFTSRGKTIIGALLDEACFFRDRATGVINDADNFDAIHARLLPQPCCKMLMVSTIWAEEGLLFEKFVSCGWELKTPSLDDVEQTKAVAWWEWSQPSEELTCIGALCPTLVMRDTPHNRKMIDDVARRDPDKALREFWCIPTRIGVGTFFSVGAIEAAIDDTITLDHPVDPGMPFERRAGADFGFRHDSSTLAITERTHARYRIVFLKEKSPVQLGHLKPSEVVREFASDVKRFGCVTVTADGVYRESILEHLIEHNLSLVDSPAGSKGKADMLQFFRSELHQGRVRIPRHPKLIKQLKELKARPVAGGGVTFVEPRSKDGHGDLRVAVVVAVWEAHYAKPPAAHITYQVDDVERAFLERQRKRDERAEFEEKHGFAPPVSFELPEY